MHRDQSDLVYSCEHGRSALYLPVSLLVRQTAVDIEET